MSLSEKDWNWIKAAIEEKMVEYNGCWIWYGAKNGGYPHIMNIALKTRSVARIVWEQWNGRQLENYEKVKRNCGNRLCINPEHLYLSKSGRNKKYSEQIRNAIIYLRDLGATNADIAKTLEIPYYTVYNIYKRGK